MSRGKLRLWMRGLALCVLVGATVPLAAIVEAQQAPPDHAHRLPEIAELARQYPNDWEQRLHPSVRTMAQFQRLIGPHASVVAWADSQPSPTDPNGVVAITVTEWDRADLFAKGLPRTFNGKPVRIEVAPGVDTPRFKCDYLNPVQGGVAFGNDRLATNNWATVGGVVYGFGSPSTTGWKYAVGVQHNLTFTPWDNIGGAANDVISQPRTSCANARQIGNLVYIPPHLRIQFNNTATNPIYQESALVSLTNNNILSSDIYDIGFPTGSHSPQPGWCGRVSGASVATTPGRARQSCIQYTGVTWIVDYGWRGKAYYADGFQVNWVSNVGDSGALWLDFDRRVHGQLVSGTATSTTFTNWAYTELQWNVKIGTS